MNAVLIKNDDIFVGMWTFHIRATRVICKRKPADVVAPALPRAYIDRRGRSSRELLSLHDTPTVPQKHLYLVSSEPGEAQEGSLKPLEEFMTTSPLTTWFRPKVSNCQIAD